MKNKILRIAVFVIMLVSFSITVSASGQSTQSTTLTVTEDGKVMESFAVVGMMPGDTEYQTFDLQITHENDVKVMYYFLPDDTSSLELLSALQIQVYLPQVDKVLYEGCMEEFTLDTEYIYVEAGNGKTSIVKYEITLYLPTEVGNECMDTQITGEFVWVCEEVEIIPEKEDEDEDGDKPEMEDEDSDQPETEEDDSEQPDTESEDQPDAESEDQPDTDMNEQDEEEEGAIIIPSETGDDNNSTVMLTLFVTSALIMVLLLYIRNRRRRYE